MTHITSGIIHFASGFGVVQVEAVEQVLEEKDVVSEEAFSKLEKDLLAKHLSK